MKLLIFSIILIIAIITISILIFTKTKPKNSLEPFISSLTKYASSLSIQCKPDNFDQIASNINDIISKADTLIQSDSFDSVQLKTYQDIKKKVSDLLNSIKPLPICKIDKCIQGTYDSGINMCVCQDEKYPVPIIINKNVYCYSDNCSNYPYSSFQPNESPDSSLNKCICSDGYIKDSLLPFCHNKQASQTLETYINDLTKTSFPAGISGAIGKYKDFQIVEGVMGIKNAQIGETARTLTQCIDLAKNAGKRQVIFDGVHCVYGDFSGDETVTDRANCQSALQM